MSWASGRRALIVFLLAFAGLTVLAALAVPVLFKTPTCFDQVENQDEEGVDCGGACERICLADITPPTVTFVRTLAHTNGRTDVVAYIENPNLSASAFDAPYLVEVYSPEHVVLATVNGTVDLPPASRVPIYIPSAYVGDVPVERAFLTFTDVQFSKDKDTYVIPSVGATDVVEGLSPRIVATIENPLASSVRALPVVVVVYDENGTVIGASRTIIETLFGNGEAQAVFTWNESFSAPVAKVDVLPSPLVSP